MALTIKLTPGYVYADNELDTASKRNALGNPTIALEGSIGTLALADGSVTTPKLIDGVLSADAAGRAKMQDGFLSADATGRGKVGDGFLTAVKAEETFREGVQQYFAVSSGSGTAYVVSLTPAATAYTAGMRIAFKVDVTNTAAVTLNVNGLGAQAIKAPGALDLTAGRLGIGTVVEVVYDGTNFVIVNDVNKWDVGETTPAIGLIVNQAHGLGRVPSIVRFALRCKIAELGYAFLDEVNVPTGFLSVGAGATNVFAVCSTATPTIFRKDTFVGAAITAANWKVVGYVRI